MKNNFKIIFIILFILFLGSVYLFKYFQFDNTEIIQNNTETKIKNVKHIDIKQDILKENKKNSEKALSKLKDNKQLTSMELSSLSNIENLDYSLLDKYIKGLNPKIINIDSIQIKNVGPKMYNLKYKIYYNDIYSSYNTINDIYFEYNNQTINILKKSKDLIIDLSEGYIDKIHGKGYFIVNIYSSNKKELLNIKQNLKGIQIKFTAFYVGKKYDLSVYYTK